MAEKKIVRQTWAETYGAPVCTVSQAKSLILLNWGLARPVALVGPPGVGKTQVMKQAAAEYKKRNNLTDEEFGFVYVMMPHITAEVLTGLVYFGEQDDGTFRHMHHEDFVRQIKKPHGIFIFDEFNRCPDRTLLNAFFAWVTERGANGLQLQEGWTIVGAVNPSTGDFSVTQVERDGAVRRRVAWVEVSFNPAEALMYFRANPDKFHPEVTRFLTANPDFIFSHDAQDNGKIGPTPASWEDVSQKLFKNESLPEEQANGPDILEIAIAGHIGIEEARRFMQNYKRKTIGKFPEVIDILKSWDKPWNPGGKKKKKNGETEEVKTVADFFKEKALKSAIKVSQSEEESDQESNAEESDGKGWLLKTIEGCVNVFGMTSEKDLMEILELPPDTKNPQQAIVEKVSAVFIDMIVTLPEDLVAVFLTYIKNVTQEGGQSGRIMALSMKFNQNAKVREALRKTTESK